MPIPVCHGQAKPAVLWPSTAVAFGLPLNAHIAHSAFVILHSAMALPLPFSPRPSPLVPRLSPFLHPSITPRKSGFFGATFCALFGILKIVINRYQGGTYKKNTPCSGAHRL
jgi:hypothetical protein